MFFLALFVLDISLLYFFSKVLSKSLSQIFLRITKSQTATIQLLSIIFLPGVILHELAHFLVASILFVKVGDMEFLPTISENAIKLGSVAIGRADPFRRIIIGFAPVFLGILTFIASIYYLTQTPFLITVESYIGSTGKIVMEVIIVYFLFAVSNTMFSSKKDLEGSLLVLILAILIIAVSYFLGFRIEFSFLFSLPSDKFLNLIKKADLYLTIPIFIDAIIYSWIKLFIRGKA